LLHRLVNCFRLSRFFCRHTRDVIKLNLMRWNQLFPISTRMHAKQRVGFSHIEPAYWNTYLDQKKAYRFRGHL
jgi:hypothetical protein